MADYQDLSGQAQYNHGPLSSVNGFVFHHTGGRGTPQGVINTLNQRGLGVQYVMDRDGTIYRTLPAGARGAHIQNSPDGTLSNDNTEGMEVIANNDGDITPAQVASAQQFANEYRQQHPGIQFYGHGQVNPGHKEATEGQTIVQAISGGTGATTATTTPAGPDTRQLVFDTLVKEGLSPQQALGALWSMGGESHSTLDANAFNPKDPKGGAFGIAQWQGTRRTDLENYAAQQGKPKNDPTVQVGFLLQELRGNEAHAFQLLQQAKTPEEATRIWTKYFERPQVDNSEGRIAAGKRVGTLDAQGNFAVGDRAPATSTPASTTTSATPTSQAPRTETPAARGDTSTPVSRVPQTPEQAFSSSLGQALASIGNTFGGGGGGGNPGANDPVDAPPIRMPGLNAAQAPLAPDARPAQYQGIGNQLAALSAQGQPTLADPETNPLLMGGITQGAPGMTSLLGVMGTPSTFNYTDQRSAQPIPNSLAGATRGVRFA